VVLGTNKIVELMPAPTGTGTALPIAVSTLSNVDILDRATGEVCIGTVFTDSAGHVASSTIAEYSALPNSISAATEGIIGALRAGVSAGKTATDSSPTGSPSSASATQARNSGTQSASTGSSGQSSVSTGTVSGTAPGTASGTASVSSASPVSLSSSSVSITFSGGRFVGGQIEALGGNRFINISFSVDTNGSSPSMGFYARRTYYSLQSSQNSLDWLIQLGYFKLIRSSVYKGFRSEIQEMAKSILLVIFPYLKGPFDFAPVNVSILEMCASWSSEANLNFYSCGC